MVLGVLAVAGFVLGRRRALALAGGSPRKLHSLSTYYGWHGALMATIPALAVMAAWLIAQPLVIEGQMGAFLPAEQLTAAERILFLAEVQRVAGGLDVAVARGALTEDQVGLLRAQVDGIRALLAGVGVALGAEVTPPVLDAAREYRELAQAGAVWRTLLTVLVALAGVAYAIRASRPEFRARNRVEVVIVGVLIAASTIAILTTVAIFLSMATESARFFAAYPIGDFFFGLTWRPAFHGGSELGLLPLLWGTLYIALVAMIVAVPIGLFTAIYLAEYASPYVRSIAKPAIEVIAGIPTVVFALFALVTVGPMLRDYFALPLGLGDSSSSVMTAGIVIGVLNVPFISSLADDIINAVPQSLRDGSYGLGATKSETVRQVVLPAALPGIMGAVLLALSRSIGETMIVVLGAGAAAKLDLNPFEAMTTITVKIVSQLTGDLAFDSPETLVAFALGISLFVMTLGINVVALWIVRRYREQYE